MYIGDLLREMGIQKSYSPYRILGEYLVDSLELIRFIVESEQKFSFAFPLGELTISLLDKPLNEVENFLDLFMKRGRHYD